MRVSLFPCLDARSTVWAKISCSLVAGTVLLSGGCLKRDVNRKTGTSGRGDEAVPTLDVRGGTADSDVYLGKRTPFEGVPGGGGEIRVTTSGGNITVSDAALSSTAQNPTFAGTGFDVASGQKVHANGSYVVDWLRVQEGGVLALRDDTLFIVLGDVLVAGRIDGRGTQHSIDGRDLSIDAGGIVNITGVIDTSGYELDPDELSPTERIDAPGGHGGEIYISSAETTADSPGPHVFVSGEVRSNGGNTTSQDADSARPGRGGQILIGTGGLFALGGKILARGGRCYFNAEGNEGDGGEIELVALDDMEIAGVRELNANGGDASGGVGGDGGSILFEAPVGTLDLSSFDIECRGGRTTFDPTGIGGDGGEVVLSAADINLATMTIDTSGGDAVLDGDGEGGAGGRTALAGTSSISVNPDVVILAEGGDTNFDGSVGGEGGTVQVANYDESDATAIDFEGAVSVDGGKDPLNSSGENGEICSVNSNTASDLKLVGGNNYPISNCTTDDLDGVVVHDLDCDDATIRPDSLTTVLPVISGRDFYRLVVTQAMIDDGVTEVTVDVTGEASGNVDLYVGPAAALGSSSVAAYNLSSTEPDSEETIDVDITGLTAGQFRAVMVVEQFNFVEEYTISVTCGS